MRLSLGFSSVSHFSSSFVVVVVASIGFDIVVATDNSSTHTGRGCKMRDAFVFTVAL